MFHIFNFFLTFVKTFFRNVRNFFIHYSWKEYDFLLWVPVPARKDVICKVTLPCMLAEMQAGDAFFLCPKEARENFIKKWYCYYRFLFYSSSFELPPFFILLSTIYYFSFPAELKKQVHRKKKWLLLIWETSKFSVFFLILLRKWKKYKKNFKKKQEQYKKLYFLPYLFEVWNSLFFDFKKFSVVHLFSTFLLSFFLV